MDKPAAKPNLPAAPELKKRLSSKRSLVGGTALICVLISAGAFFLVVQPQWSRVGVGKELDVAAMQATLDERERYLSQLKSLRSNYEAIPADQIVLLSSILPTDKHVPELLTQLEAIGQQTGVDITDINISDVTEASASARQQLQQEVSGNNPRSTAKSVKAVNIQLQVTTDKYDRFKPFIEALQTNDRILDVESYTFSTDQEVQTAMIKAYYLAS